MDPAIRGAPGNPEHDVLTRLIQGEAGGEQLSEVELLQNCIFILNAGFILGILFIAFDFLAGIDWLTGQ